VGSHQHGLLYNSSVFLHQDTSEDPNMAHRKEYDEKVVTFDWNHDVDGPDGVFPEHLDKSEEHLRRPRLPWSKGAADDQSAEHLWWTGLSR
jgi:hypothetical protein